MTIKALVDRFDGLFSTLNSSEELVKLLQNSSTEFAAMTAAFAAASKEGSDSSVFQFQNLIHDGFRHAREEVDAWSTVDLFESVYRVRSAIEGFVGSEVPPATDRDSVADQLKKFSDTYGRYIKSTTRPNLIVLLEAGDRALRALQAFSSAAFILRSLAAPEPNISRGEDSVSIFLPREIGLGGIAEKIEATRGIYQETCELYDISTNQFPLRVLKIESGSFWLLAAGAKQAMSVLRDLIRGATNYFLQSYTLEGKVNQVGLKTDVVKKVLDLHTQLKQGGFNVDNQRHHLEKASNAICQELITLLQGEDSIEVDGESLPLTSEGKQKLLVAAKRLALPPRT